MVKRLGKFELPNRLTKVEQTVTDTYTMFIAEPFEVGFTHSIGNALRRILMSSIEGLPLFPLRSTNFRAYQAWLKTSLE
jgi:DNA-directed RNA polymerase subunit alpha